MSRHRWPGGKKFADDFLTEDACLNGCGSMRRYVEVPPKLPGKPWTSLREEYSLDGGKTWSALKRVPPCFDERRTIAGGATTDLIRRCLLEARKDVESALEGYALWADQQALNALDSSVADDYKITARQCREAATRFTLGEGEYR